MATYPAFVQNDCWNLPKKEGFSFFDQIIADQYQDNLFQPPIGTTGISSTAYAIDKFLPDMVDKMNYWFHLMPRQTEAYQEEVIVLMPPKRKYEIDIEVNYQGRAKPLIYIDEIEID